MDDEIKMKATVDPMRPECCRFAVDRPLYEGGSAYFKDREAAEGSLLAERLFDLGKVDSLRIAGRDVFLTKYSVLHWQDEVPRMAKIIQDHIRSGKAAVSEEFQAKKLPDNVLMARLQEFFDAEINPSLEQHGGYIKLVDVKEGSMYVNMGGGCQGCAMAKMTLRKGIEEAARRHFPHVGEILDATDHASGANPYYVK